MLIFEIERLMSHNSARNPASYAAELGVGRVIYLAVLQRDAPVVIVGTLSLVLIFVFVNLIVDIAYAVLDPRIRYHKKEINV